MKGKTRYELRLTNNERRGDEAKLEINGQVVVASPGDSIYRAAKRAGIDIPGLCTSDHLVRLVSCRLCLCEVQGQSGMLASCTTPARDGMVVHTESERLNRLRKHLTELYLSEQPAGDRVPEPLQALAGSYGLTHVRYPQPASRAPVVDRSNPFFVFDNAVCIARRVCEPATRFKARMPSRCCIAVSRAARRQDMRR